MGCAIDFSLKGHTVDWRDHLWEMQKYKRKRFEKVHLKERFSLAAASYLIGLLLFSVLGYDS